MNYEFWEVLAEMTPPLWAKRDSKPMLYGMRRRIALLIAVLLSIQGVGFAPANAAVTWSQVSKFDTGADGSNYNSQYDLGSSSVYIFDNDIDNIYFYLDFVQTPTVNMFNDGLDSFAGIELDYDLNEKTDVYLWTKKLTLTTDRTTVSGSAYDSTNSKTLNCSVDIFTNIGEGEKWIGFKVSRICIKLPNSFSMTGITNFSPNNKNLDFYDYAPWPRMPVNLLGSSTAVNPTTGNSFSGFTHALPTSSPNSSYKSSNFTEPPKDLSKLSEQLLPSVVTVRCLTGSGTGWSADLKLSNASTHQELQFSGRTHLVKKVTEPKTYPSR
jgi:hypothetical protein